MGRAFGNVHTFAHTRWHPPAFVATKASGSLLDVPMNIPLHDYHTPQIQVKCVLSKDIPIT